MKAKDWKDYRRQAEAGGSPELKTSAVLDLLNERDKLRATVRKLRAEISTLKTLIPSPKR